MVQVTLYHRHDIFYGRGNEYSRSLFLYKPTLTLVRGFRPIVNPNTIIILLDIDEEITLHH